jgi:hypothetical protein
MFGRLLTVLGAVSVLGIGGAAMVWPRQATRTYGIPKDGPNALAYVRATAARDLVMGAFVLWGALAGDRRAVEAGLGVCTFAPLADFLIVAHRRGAVPQLVLHASGVAGILVTLAIVRAGK